MDSSSAPEQPTRRPGDSVSGAIDPRIGAALGKYRLLARLGRGGMGVVYRAEDTLLRRHVAIKVLSHPTSAPDDDSARFLREAQAVARLHHPNVVTIHDAGKQDGVDYFVMELVEGESAQDALDARGAFPWREATSILVQVCRGLAAAHGAGLIHRDIKPSNVMLCADGTVKLADFGLVRAVDGSGTSLTGSGGILGTPHYMSPEQARGEKVDERSDIYSLGATYCALLCGGPPYTGESSMAILFAHCSSPVPDPRSVVPATPEACATIVRRAMAKEPFDRHGSATVLLAEAVRAMEGSAAARREAGASSTDIADDARGPDGRARPPTRGVLRSRVAWALAAAAALAVAWSIVHSRPPSSSGAPSQAGPAAPRPLHPWKQRLLAEGLDIQMQGKTSAVAFSPDGTRFAAGAYDGSLRGVRLWNFDTGEELTSLWPRKAVHGIRFSRTGDVLAASGRGDLRLRDLASGREWTTPGGREDSSVYSVCFFADGKTVAAGIEPEEGKESAGVHLADVASGEVRILRGPKAWVWGLAVSADGRRLAAGGRDGQVHTWDLPSEEPREELSTGLVVSQVAFSPTDGTLAVCGGPTIQLWDVSTATRLREWTDPRGEIWCLAWSPDGAVLAAGGTQVTLWDPNTGKSVGSIEGHGDAVGGVAYSPDGQILATACWDGVVRLRPVRSGAAHRSGDGR